MEEGAQEGIAARVAKIRTQVQRHGESHVSPGELHLLCGTATDPHAQLKAVTQIAQWEQWNFEFLPDGSVRFVKIQGSPEG